MVADPSRSPNAQRIIGGSEQRRYRVGLVVVQNIEGSRAQAGERLIESSVNRTPTSELIVRDGIDVRRRSKWIENDRDTAGRGSRGTDRVVVEVERAIEQRRLARVVDERT